MCLLFAKSGVELLLLTLGGKNQFWRWQAWLLLLGLGVFALLQLWYLHRALILADPTLVCPRAFGFSLTSVFQISMLMHGLVAFCFYNISSIVNGLVYFDQFSLIPWNHLALVGLGIIILLGGVWIVSFNSGGGGVNVGTWRDEESEESEGDGLGSCEEMSPDARGRPGRDTILLERSAISESDTPSCFAHDPQPQAGSPRRVQDYASLSPSVSDRPSLSIRTGVQRRRPTNELRSPVQQHHHNVFAPQLPGFSIGISPASPGFVVVPRERRRKVSGLSVETQLRRSQSEGDGFPVPDPVDEALERTFSEGAELDPPLPPGRMRWRWLRGVFKRTDKTR